ncbi:DUF6221 family protein [Streptomyces niveus]|uniref:DUF6221 family protein n=1 Tax=Streptomyces niveus TaxID=193462 RepID=UPI003417A777
MFAVSYQVLRDESARWGRGEADGGWDAQRIDDDTWEVRSRGAVLATNLEQGDVEHIARHDPARVLREIQAHRATVDEYDIALGVCPRIAAVRADHPDCMEAWRP